MRRWLPLALGLLFAAPVVFTPQARAQEDWGITRDRNGGRDSRPERQRGQRQRPQRRPSASGDADGSDRTDTLIQRYKRVLRQKPDNSFAFQRLLDLYRKRDGNIDTLIEEIESDADERPDAYAPHMLLGHIYRAQGRDEQARRAYERAAELGGDRGVPLEAMAEIDRDQGRLERARELFEQALEHSRGGSERRELLRSLGEVAVEQKDWDGARGYYQRLARGARGSVYLLTEYARVLQEHDEHERAIGEYERVLGKLRGDNRVLGPVLRDLGRAQLEAGKPGDAIESLDRALRVAGGRSGVRREIYDVLVDAYRRTDRLPELVDRLERERGNSFESLRLRGRLHDELGNQERALEDYRRALKMRPRHIDTRVRVVQLLSRAGRIDRVIAEYRKLIRLAPGEPRFVVELAQLLMRTGKRDEALELAERTSRRYPREAAVHQQLAELYSEWGEDDKATREVRKLAEIEPNDPQHLVALGAQQLSAGRKDEAIATWRRILKVDPNKARAYATLGGVYADHDLLERAEKAYREAVERDAEKLAYVRGLANVLERPREHESSSRKRRREEEAVRWWKKVLELSGEDDRSARREARKRIVAIWSRRRELHHHMERWKQSFSKPEPELEAGRFLAEAYLRQRPRELTQAQRVLQKIIEQAPGDVGSLLSLERVQTARGDLAGAIATLRKLVDANPRKATSYLQRMAEHSLALYRDEQAVEYAEMAVERTPDDAQAHRRLGELYRSRQDMEQAIASYRRAIELNERMYPTYLDLAEIHMARSELEAADRLFRNVMRASPDDDLVERAARASIQIHLGEGSLDELETDLLPLALAHPRRPVFRKLVVELYDAMTQPLIRRVRKGGDGARQAKARLERIGSRAIKPLLDALGDDDPAQQRVAVDILGHLGNENAAEPLLGAAEDGDGDIELRARALAAAGAVARAELTDRFVALAQGPERRLRGMAVWSLARIGGREATDALRQLIEEGDPAVRGFAALGLGRAGAAAAADALEGLLREDRNAEVQACAAWALGRLGGRDHVPALVAALRGAEGVVARASATALGRLGDPGAREALAQALFDASAEQRDAGAAALRRLGRESEQPEQTRFPVPPRIVSAGEYLGLLLSAGAGAHGEPVDLEPLRGALVTAARDALRGPVERVRTALSVLTGEGGKLAAGPLTGGIEGWPEPARRRAQRALAVLARELLPEIVEASRHPDPTARSRAVVLLTRIDDPEAGGALVRALDDEEPAVQRAALVALGHRPDGAEQARQRVARILGEHPDWSTRMRAAETLGALGGDAAVQALTESLREDSYAFVREAAAEALGRSGRPQARAALEGAARGDVEGRVREAARRALESLEPEKASAPD